MADVIAEKIDLRFHLENRFERLKYYCKIKLSIIIGTSKADMENPWVWEGSDIFHEDAKKIQKIAMSKEQAILHSKDKKDVIRNFANLKMRVFPDEQPTSNFKVIDEWFKQQSKLIEIENSIKHIENEINGKTENDLKEDLKETHTHKIQQHEIEKLLEKRTKEIQDGLRQEKLLKDAIGRWENEKPF